MGGAVYQLKVKGIQDIHLTGNPEHNFIKQVYKRHSNFAIEQKKISFNNYVDFDKKFEITIPRKGDFLHKIYLAFQLPPLISKSGSYAGWTNSLGHAIIDYVELVIGESVIDKHYGLFLEIWNELTADPGVNSVENSMIGKFNNVESLNYSALHETTYQVPMKFWFCNNIGAALPLIALNFHVVKLIFKFKKFDECIVYDGNIPPDQVNIHNPHILADFIFMDDCERIKYAQKEHKYLITQTQFLGKETINYKTNGGFYRSLLPFNHPCLELIFVLREKDNDDNNDWFNFSKRQTSILTKVEPLIKSAKLVLDGIDRVDDTSEFTLRVNNNSRYHKNTPSKHIYTMSFCNEPEKYYPTGSLNFSLIDQPELIINTSANINSIPSLFVFSRNFNIINIKKGQFSLNFSS